MVTAILGAVAAVSSGTVSAAGSGGEGETAPEFSEDLFFKEESLGRGGDLDEFLTDVVPDWPGWSRVYWTDRELWGNQGYIIGGPGRKPIPQGPAAAGYAEALTVEVEEPLPPELPYESVDLEIERQRADTHTVVKGECLWIIAGYPRIYGNPLQWPIIFQANRDRIKNPDLIYPGQVFIIPRD